MILYIDLGLTIFGYLLIHVFLTYSDSGSLNRGNTSSHIPRIDFQGLLNCSFEVDPENVAQYNPCILFKKRYKDLRSILEVMTMQN